MADAIDGVQYIALPSSLLIVIQNGLVLLFVSLKSDLRRKPFMFYTLSLCTSDLLFGITELVGNIATLIDQINFSITVCVLVQSIWTLSVLTSAALSLVVCVHHYMHMRRFPARYARLYNKQKVMVVCLVWCACLLITALAHIVERTEYMKGQECSPMYIYEFPDSMYFTVCIILVPLYVGTIVLYGMMVQKIRRVMVTMPLTGSDAICSNEHTDLQKVLKRTFISLTIMSGVRVICLLPTVLHVILSSFRYTYFLKYVARSVHRLNTLITPYMYIWRLEDFRKSLKTSFCRMKKLIHPIGPINSGAMAR